jgi:hypothetical protein
MPAAPGIPSSTINRPARLAPSPSRRRTPTSSTSEAARDCSVPIFRWATACTNRSTAERRGAISVCATANRFPRSWSTPRIPTVSSSPSSAIPTGRMPNAASSARPTAGRASKRSYIRMTAPAPSTWPSIPPIHAWSMPCCGRRSRVHGRTARLPGPTADSSNRPTAATIGPSSPADSPPSRKGSAASASASRPATAIACTR